MFRAIPCSSSEGQTVLLQHLVSSLSVSSYSVHRFYYKVIMEGIYLKDLGAGFERVGKTTLARSYIC